METFYRVLTPRCGDEPGTIERWKQGKYTSTHREVPGHWTKKWLETGSTNPADYGLEYNCCQYTPGARESFHRFAPLHKPDEIWPDNELVLAGEYEGVSAYDNPGGALKYGQGPAGKLFAVFNGHKLAPIPAESEDGGCRVKFVREIIEPMNRDEFILWMRIPKGESPKESNTQP